ncbi:MAG: glycosyltransferase family 2 protein [Acidobacteria bacterium]|nr:MAG: glycosyltransferase family 2 protein [Acidobacteriota bacterium]
MGRPLLSACLIVRDEEERLGRCLTSLRPVADELVVADTGSADRSREIARRHGARVVDIAWRDDFAAARNECLERARGAWILVVDADEVLENPDRAALEGLLAASDAPGFTVEIVSARDGGDEEIAHVARLFRNLPSHRYRGRVHEQILPALAASAGRPDWTPPRSGLRLRHEGYLAEVRERRNKLERNRRLLREEIARRPHDPGPRYFLARELAPHIGGDLLDMPPADEAWEAVRPAVEAVLSGPPCGLTDPLGALGVRLAVVRGEDELARRWSEMLGKRVGRSARWCYAEGERLLTIGAMGDREAAETAAGWFAAAAHAPEGSPAVITPRRLRTCWAPVRRDLARCLAGRDRPAQTATGEGVEPLLARAWAEAASGRSAAAVRLLADGVRRDRGDPRLWLALAVALRVDGETRRACRAARAALAAAPGWRAAEEWLAGRPAPFRGLLAPWSLAARESARA